VRSTMPPVKSLTRRGVSKWRNGLRRDGSIVALQGEAVNPFTQLVQRFGTRTVCGEAKSPGKRVEPLGQMGQEGSALASVYAGHSGVSFESGSEGRLHLAPPSSLGFITTIASRRIVGGEANPSRGFFNDRSSSGGFPHHGSSSCRAMPYPVFVQLPEHAVKKE